MQVAIDEKKAALMHSNGDRVQEDASQPPFIHISPTLWLPVSLKELVKEDPYQVQVISLIADGIDGFEFPEDAELTRPAPNINYMMFRAPDGRIGFYVPVADNMPEYLTITAQYRITFKMQGYDTHTFNVLHSHRMLFDEPYSDSQCYSSQSSQATFLSQQEYDRVFKNSRIKDQLKVFDRVDECENTTSITLVTGEEAEPLTDRFVITSMYENETPTWKKSQSIDLSKFNEEHRANGIVTMPIGILSEAIEYAGLMQYDGTTMPEDHFALQHLCSWWNNHPDVPDSAKNAKSCQILVRYDNSDSYHDIDEQVPRYSISKYFGKASSAVIGDHFIVMFTKGFDEIRDDGVKCTAFLVDGLDYEDIFIEKSEMKPGHETMANIGAIPHRYRSIYNHYLS